MPQDELEALLRTGHEHPNLECKGPGDLDNKDYFARVARAAMAMGNRRDGGIICLGIADDTIAEMQPGLSDDQVTAWTHFDNVSDKLARFGDPPIAFSTDAVTLSSGATIVVLEVAQFSDTPHICIRDHERTTKAGQIYVRPRSKPSSVPVPTAVDMRDLLDLAIDNGVRDFVGRLRSSGVLSTPAAPVPDSSDQFDAEASEFWTPSSDVLDTVATAAYFDISIRPEPYADRMAANELKEFITTRAVSMRGWPVPFVDRRVPVENHGTWIGQQDKSDIVPHVEAWRFATSGQFAQRRVLASNFSRDHELIGIDHPEGGTVVVWDVLLYLVEVAELGARIATATECDAITFTVALAGIEGCSLYDEYYARGFPVTDPLATDRIEAVATVDTPRLLQQPRVVGRELAQSMLRQFGASIPDQVLDENQAEIFRR